MAVRREKVVLELEDHLSTGMVKAAAATALLDKSLTDLDGSTIGVSASTEKAAKSTKEYGLEAAIADEKAARLKKTLRDQARASLDAEDGIGGLRRETDRADHSINQLTGRLRLFADAAAILGPSLVPVSAVAVPAITGLASQLGFAALGMGSLVTASVGVGDALKAVNEAALEPTAANLEKARVAMEKLGPEAQAFVSRFQELRPVLRDIRDQAAAGWFPGLTEALDHFEDVAPRVATIFERIGEAGGNLVAEGAEALAGPEWSEFLTFIETSAPKALDELGRTVGNVISGLADLWMAFDPLNDDFSSWLLEISRSFAEWADGLSQTQGFADFVEYIRTNGPRVADALMAVADAVIQIVEALAPLGGPSLKIIETFANAIANIADSDLGTPILAGVAALSIYNRTLAITSGLQAKVGVVAAGGKGGKMTALANAAPLALTAGIGNQVASDVGGKNEIFGVNPFNSSPQNALEALVNWDPDDFIFTDTVKSVFTGGDKDTSGRNGVQLAFELGNRKKAADAAREAEAADLGLSSATSQLARSIGLSNLEMAESIGLLDKRTSASLGAFGAETRYRQALRAANEQANTNNAGIKGDSEAALANRSALEQLAMAWGAQRDAMVETGESADAIEAKYRTARKAFVDTATAMGVPIDQARKLARELNLIPTDLVTEFRTRTGAASAEIESIIEQLQSVPRSIRTDFYVNQVNASSLLTQGGRDGDPSTPYANGGLVRGPGGPREDLVPIRASNMEYVVNADAVQHYGVDFFNAANAKRLGDGAVQSVRVPSQMGGTGLSSADIDRIVSGLASVRPMYGDVKIQPHNYSEFTRQMDNDRRAMAVGGFGK